MENFVKELKECAATLSRIADALARETETPKTDAPSLEEVRLVLAGLACLILAGGKPIHQRKCEMGIRKRFEQGRPNSFCIYGYRWDGEKFVVVPEEAKIVRLIYDNFLHGISAEQTEKQLAGMGVKSYTGQHFSNSSIRAILKNEKYTGNMLLQKEYTPSHIDHKTKKNSGELPQYWVADSHEAIIPLGTFEAVQEEIKHRRELGALANVLPLSGNLSSRYHPPRFPEQHCPAQSPPILPLASSEMSCWRFLFCDNAHLQTIAKYRCTPSQKIGSGMWQNTIPLGRVDSFVRTPQRLFFRPSASSTARL